MLIQKITLFFMALIFSSNGTFAQTTDNEAEVAAVRKCFEDYKSAALNEDYSQLLMVIDSSHTLAFYDKVLEHILYSPPETVDSLNIFEKLTVLMIRQEAKPEVLKNYRAEDLLLYTFKNGMMGKNTLEANTLGEVLLDKNNAQGRLLVNTFKTPAFYQFYKVDGVWKIDITSIFPQSAAAFQQMAARNKVNENTYIFSLIETISGSPAQPSLWEPLLKNNTK